MNDLKYELACFIHDKLYKDAENKDDVFKYLLSLSEEQLDAMMGNYYLYEITNKTQL